jgi:integrase
LAVATGTDIAVVQELLGHTDIRTTRRYVDIANDIKKQAVEKVAAALFDGALASLLQPAKATTPRQG